jgi:hypothetical protein
MISCMRATNYLGSVLLTRDWVDWVLVSVALLSFIATAAAAWLAWLAIRRANMIATQADEALVRERRKTFELGVLARIGEVYGLRQSGSVQALRGLMLTLPDDAMPELRRWLGKTKEESVSHDASLRIDEKFHGDLEAAVASRIAEPAIGRKNR